MTAMVDTESLRSVSNRLGSVPFEGTLEQRMILVRAEVELVAAADEVDRLRADNERLDGEHASVKAQRDHIIAQYQALRSVIENAPHYIDPDGWWCQAGNGDDCTCWKADAL